MRWKIILGDVQMTGHFLIKYVLVWKIICCSRHRYNKLSFVTIYFLKGSSYLSNLLISYYLLVHQFRLNLTLNTSQTLYSSHYVILWPLSPAKLLDEFFSPILNCCAKSPATGKALPKWRKWRGVMYYYYNTFTVISTNSNIPNLTIRNN